MSDPRLEELARRLRDAGEGALAHKVENLGLSLAIDASGLDVLRTFTARVLGLRSQVRDFQDAHRRGNDIV